MNMTPEKPQKSGRALSFIILCLLASGVVRLAIGEQAIAKEVVALADGSVSQVLDHDELAAACAEPPDTALLLQAIQTRQARLDEREARLENRLQALNIAERKIRENTDALLAAEEKLAATLAIADDAAEADLLRLTAVYENMKAGNAARLFSAMAPEFAAGFLGRMRADAAASIMSDLQPENAYAISLILAGRNARAPQQ
jgi:flagellar motility protein MotE (MotC chaperone)